MPFLKIVINEAYKSLEGAVTAAAVREGQ